MILCNPVSSTTSPLDDTIENTRSKATWSTTKPASCTRSSAFCREMRAASGLRSRSSMPEFHPLVPGLDASEAAPCERCGRGASIGCDRVPAISFADPRSHFVRRVDRLSQWWWLSRLVWSQYRCRRTSTVRCWAELSSAGGSSLACANDASRSLGTRLRAGPGAGAGAGAGAAAVEYAVRTSGVTTELLDRSGSDDCEDALMP